MERFFFFFQCSVPPWKALSDLAGRQSHMRVKEGGKSGRDRLHRWNIYHWRAELKHCPVYALCRFCFFFFDVAQGHLLSAAPPDLCHQWRGSDNMGLERNALHPLCAVPATVLEIQLLSGQLTVPAQADLFGTGRKEECNSANSEALICTLLPSL